MLNACHSWLFKPEETVVVGITMFASVAPRVNGTPLLDKKKRISVMPVVNIPLRRWVGMSPLPALKISFLSQGRQLSLSVSVDCNNILNNRYSG